MPITLHLTHFYQVYYLPREYSSSMKYLYLRTLINEKLIYVLQTAFRVFIPNPWVK